MRMESVKLIIFIWMLLIGKNSSFRRITGAPMFTDEEENNFRSRLMTVDLLTKVLSMLHRHRTENKYYQKSIDLYDKSGILLNPEEQRTYNIKSMKLFELDELFTSLLIRATVNSAMLKARVDDVKMYGVFKQKARQLLKDQNIPEEDMHILYGAIREMSQYSLPDLSVDSTVNGYIRNIKKADDTINADMITGKTVEDLSDEITKNLIHASHIAIGPAPDETSDNPDKHRAKDEDLDNLNQFDNYY
ncbi:hypothetical protein SNEBB_002204 [Seison nebaliae]|nr:hypothetical protein SNEBB_002204 [Seison nebaliae]